MGENVAYTGTDAPAGTCSSLASKDSSLLAVSNHFTCSVVVVAESGTKSTKRGAEGRQAAVEIELAAAATSIRG